MRTWQATQRGRGEILSQREAPGICARSKPTQVPVRRVVTDWPLEHNFHVFPF